MSQFVIELPIRVNRTQQRYIAHAFWLLNRFSTNVTRVMKSRVDYWTSTKEYKSFKPKKGEKKSVSIKKKIAYLKEHCVSSSEMEKLCKMPKVWKKSTIISSHSLKTIGNNIYGGFEKVLFGDGKEINTFKKVDTINFPCYRNNGKLLFYGLKLDKEKCLITFSNHNDSIPFIAKTEYDMHALSCDFVNVRLVRRFIRGRYKYYVQFTCEGVPYGKNRQHGDLIIGIDPSQQKMNVATSDGDFMVYSLVEGQENDTKKRLRLERKLDRQRRANNLEAFNEDGTISKYFTETKKANGGKYPWKKSKGYKKTSSDLSDIHRRLASLRKTKQHFIANEILSMAKDIHVEHNNFKALSKRAKETTKNENGKYNKKKRFGKSILKGAPSQFIDILKYKSKFYGVDFLLVSENCACTQFDHTSGEFMGKQPLSKRSVILSDGTNIGRDANAAFNLIGCIRNNPQYQNEIPSKTMHGKDSIRLVKNKVEKDANHFEIDMISKAIGEYKKKCMALA